ncbi:PKD domain-containing protein [Roseibacillus persicicus]|uniref:PKD domain-containing protein n=1 Tax=Roseibacillus persicicus TaxID=454148 RepID=UPI00280E9B05|nr:hypothetical protein [Roseibacillus persicicus]MDQ8188949.1 hypothetical protein [Roseibacillus persicicus]
MKRIFFTLILAATNCLAQIYQESGGLVVMEAENTSSPLGLWQEESSLANFSGDGYLRFLGNTFETGPATSPLEYHFRVHQGGLYYLHLHCAKETHDGRTDVANDAYIRVEGDYTAGPGPHDGHGDNASFALLSNDTKYFGGATNSWKWENGQNSSGGAGNLDPGGHQNKRVAVYDFKAGETYKLVMSGRSKFFRVNRIVLRHVDTAQSLAQNLNTPESETGAGGESFVYDATDDFTDIAGGDVPYYRDNGNDALAIAANIVANRTGFARATRTFDGSAATYDVTITTMTEEDGESEYHLLVNGQRIRSYTNPFVYDPPESPLDLQPQNHTWTGVSIPAGATIGIESNADTNGEIPEEGGTAWARGRWRQLEFRRSSSLIQPPAGRIAIVADGNSPDPDDIGATAVMLGLFKGAGLRDRLVHLSHSCDLDPFRNPGRQVIDAANELRRQNKLHELCGEGIGFFGPFENLENYYNCRTSMVGEYNVQAVNDLRNAINASSVEDPLWIIEAGEPDVIGYALQAAIPSRRQHVHVISHHPANDNSGDFFTWQQILDFGVTEHQVGDQNVGLQVLISSGLWDWAENHSSPGIAWIWDQLDYAEKDGVVSFQNNKFDCSDAGMLYWWMTGGPNGGDGNSTPVEMRNLLLRDHEDAEPARIELLAAWDQWSNGEAPNPTFLAVNVTATAAATSEGLSWGVNDERGASNDGSWGSFVGEPAASVGVADQENLSLFNATTGGTLTFTISNNGPQALVLDGFHFDAYAFRPKAARSYRLEVLPGGGLTVGTVSTSADQAITSVAGANNNGAHDDIDLSLTGLADHTLAVGESVSLRLTFTGGEGDGSGGHHLFVDNVAVTHAVLEGAKLAPEVEAGAGASISLPVDEVILTGSASDDGAVASTEWTQESGPAIAMLSDSGSLNPVASGLKEGTYLFRLTAIDDEGNSAFDEVEVVVLPSDFTVWARGQNIPTELDTSENGDPDGDGLNNRVEYLFGLNPMDSRSANPFAEGLSKSAGTFRYTRRNPSLSGIFDYQIWTSENLSQWFQDLTARQEVRIDNDVQEVEVTLTGEGRSEKTLFVRIAVE